MLLVFWLVAFANSELSIPKIKFITCNPYLVVFLNSSKLAAGAALWDRLRMKLFDVEAFVVVSLILRAVSGLNS